MGWSHSFVCDCCGEQLQVERGLPRLETANVLVGTFVVAEVCKPCLERLTVGELLARLKVKL